MAITSKQFILLYMSFECLTLALLVSIVIINPSLITIQVALRYGLINFVASVFILYGIIRQLLLDLPVNLEGIVMIIPFEDIPMIYVSSCNLPEEVVLKIVFTLFLISLGLFIKLGIWPFSF